MISDHSMECYHSLKESRSGLCEEDGRRQFLNPFIVEEYKLLDSHEAQSTSCL